MFDAPTTNRDLVSSAATIEDVAAWNRLYAQYGPPIREHGLKSGLSDSESEEVVQEVMAKLAARLGKQPFNWNSSSFRGWLNQATNRLIFEFHRGRRRAALPRSYLPIIREWLPPAIAPELDTAARDQLESHLWSVCLARVRNEIPPDHWQIFESYALEGGKSGEVARVFNSTEINVRIIRHRTIRKLRSQWENLQNGPLNEPCE